MEGLKPIQLAYSMYKPSTRTDETLDPIVYLHSLSASKEYWLDIPQTVANVTKRESYAVDARNHGDSEWSDEFNFDVNVVDLVHFMDTKGIQKAILVGHSMGGITAIKMALMKPDRVKGIIIEDMMVRKIPKSILEHMLSLVRITRPIFEKVPAGLDDRKTAMFMLGCMICSGTSSPELKEILNKNLQEATMETFCCIFKRDAEGRPSLKCNIDVIEKAILDYDNLFCEPDGIFDGPALFIYGTESPFKVGDEIEHIKQFFPNALFKPMPANHCIHGSKPTEFSNEVLKFFANTSL